MIVPTFVSGGNATPPASTYSLCAAPHRTTVVLHGEGRAFCAGLDVKSVAGSLQVQANLKELLDRPEGEISKRVRAARTQASRSITAAPRADS